MDRAPKYTPEGNKRQSLLVMKFGGASVATPAAIAAIADLVVEKLLTYGHVAVVVSAMGNMTDQLIALAREVHPEPPKREYDMLVSVGERISVSLLAMALARKGREAVSFTGSQSGILTCENHSDAKIVDVRPQRLLQAFECGKCAIVAGFQGVSRRGEITTLGRGGSDTTAVALAIALGAERVEFFKDVAGVCPTDPEKDPAVEPYTHLGYEEAERIIVMSGGQLLHPRALRLAAQNGMPLHLRSFHRESSHPGTEISGEAPRAHSPLYEVAL